MSLTLAPLKKEDIEEKVRLNEDAKVDIYALREGIKAELKEFQWMQIRASVQCQSYQEQLEHIDFLIKTYEETGQQLWKNAYPTPVPAPSVK